MRRPARSARLRFGFSSEKDYDILSEAFHVPALAFFEAVAHGHNDDDGGNPPGNAGHGQ